MPNFNRDEDGIMYPISKFPYEKLCGEEGKDFIYAIKPKKYKSEVISLPLTSRLCPLRQSLW